MKPIFTIHEGEFLVGDHITRRLKGRFDVWIPAKDRGVDLLVTRKNRRGKPVGLQVKFSREFTIPKQLVHHVRATSWFTLKPEKIRKSQADLWVFTILTLRRDHYFVVIPTRDLRARIPRNCGKTWNLYLWVYGDRACYQVRDLRLEERISTVHRGVRDRKRNFSPWLENWKLLDRYSRRTR